MGQSLSTPQGVISIRPATPDDAAILHALRIEALARHPEAFAADFEAAVADPVTAWAERVAQYAAKEEGILSIAVAPGQAIGMLGLVRGHWPKTRHGATLWGMYVKDAWRGLRTAEALIRECCDWARTHGVTSVKLGVVTTNVAAIRCYARCGFAVYGIDPRVIACDGALYDELLMVKSL